MVDTVPASNGEPARAGAQRAGYFQRLFGYGLGDFGLNIYWNSLSLLLVFWYTSVAGLSPALAGLVFSIGLLWDAISDPIVAGLAERTRTRYGSYRPYIGLGSIVLGASFCLLFWVPPVGEGLIFWVLLFTNIVFRTCYTLVAVPYAALSSRITFDSSERGDLSGVRMTFAFIGQFCVASLAFPLARYFADRYGDMWGFFYAAAVGAVAATIILLCCAALTRELPVPNTVRGNRQRPGFFHSFARAIKRNTALQVLMAVIFLNVVAVSSTMIPLAYYISANAGRFAAIEVVMGAFSLVTLFGTIVWTLTLRRFGKRSCWFAATGVQLLAGITLLFAGPWLIAGIPLQIVTYGFCTAAYAVIIWAMVPNVVEFGQHSYGERAEGAVFGSFLLVQKGSGAIAGLGIGLVLSMLGFTAGTVQPSSQVARNLEIFLSLVPPVASFLAGWVFHFMPLNRKVHADIIGGLSVEH